MHEHTINSFNDNQRRGFTGIKHRNTYLSISSTMGGIISDDMFGSLSNVGVIVDAIVSGQIAVDEATGSEEIKVVDNSWIICEIREYGLLLTGKVNSGYGHMNLEAKVFSYGIHGDLGKFKLLLKLM
ncbi:hypothetical protein Tco_1028928 [Tanacetum coccineum]|uniref:Uncharacterized protein n=1 Tax=Tanacetum coccineum TaxID=301880 RepID=A0ABQ5G3R8_9ASTR